MAKDKNIQSLFTNVERLQRGLLKIERNSFTKNASQFVQIINTDTEGYLYFFLANGEGGKDDLRKYYANLVFEDKAESVSYQLSGYVCKCEESPSVGINFSTEENYVLLKFKIMQVEIIDFKSEEKNQPQPIISNLLNLFWKPR